MKVAKSKSSPPRTGEAKDARARAPARAGPGGCARPRAAQGGGGGVTLARHASSTHAARKQHASSTLPFMPFLQRETPRGRHAAHDARPSVHVTPPSVSDTSRSGPVPCGRRSSASCSASARRRAARATRRSARSASGARRRTRSASACRRRRCLHLPGHVTLTTRPRDCGRMTRALSRGNAA
jgi:hypothetical protein